MKTEHTANQALAASMKARYVDQQKQAAQAAERAEILRRLGV